MNKVCEIKQFYFSGKYTLKLKNNILSLIKNFCLFSNGFFMQHAKKF